MSRLKGTITAYKRECWMIYCTKLAQHENGLAHGDQQAFFALAAFAR